MNGALQAGVIANEAQRNEAICNEKENRTQTLGRMNDECRMMNEALQAGVIANEAQRNEAICNNEVNRTRINFDRNDSKLATEN
ncbi:hypothetical protein [Gaoshiqia sediminis]|uniref:Uncharacterized protein n=1 Tax=Gaoshiqia sediminis TaxID=2986998 RepID=A0AA42C8Q9_9BACT|nr:hypothetical protein [Gaoshiqia sediminis]MCW0484999.1 hypothetical protein [Gaoshiqia sediminis]